MKVLVTNAPILMFSRRRSNNGRVIPNTIYYLMPWNRIFRACITRDEVRKFLDIIGTEAEKHYRWSKSGFLLYVDPGQAWLFWLLVILGGNLHCVKEWWKKRELTLSPSYFQQTFRVRAVHNGTLSPSYFQPGG